MNRCSETLLVVCAVRISPAERHISPADETSEPAVKRRQLYQVLSVTLMVGVSMDASVSMDVDAAPTKQLFRADGRQLTTSRCALLQRNERFEI